LTQHHASSEPRLAPGDPGSAAAIAALLAKAQAIDPRFRLAESWERERLPSDQLYAFTGNDGCLVAPVFVLDPRLAPRGGPPC
jgi:hypothetical protein